MRLETFITSVTEGLGVGATVAVARNGEDFELRVREVNDLIGLTMRAVRLGIREITLEASTASLDQPPELVITFIDAVDMQVMDSMSALTARERQVMELLVSGRTRREAASDLELSARTIDTHRSHVLKKLGLRNMAELTRLAVVTGLVLT